MASILKVKDKDGNVIDIPAIKGEPGKDYVLTDADKQEIADLVGGGNTSNAPMFLVVDELPTENISNSTIYLVRARDEDMDIADFYKEYIFVNDDWELLGRQKPNLELVSPQLKDELANAVLDKLQDAEGGLY